MKHLLFLPLLILAFLLAPLVIFGADTKKAAKTDSPANGNDTPQPPAAESAPGDPKAADDADSNESDKADADKPKPRKTGSRPTSMAVTAVRSGLKTLTIHFRWSLYPNASIEVRLVPSTEPKGATVAPIYFSENLKGKVQDELYACLDHSGEGGRDYTFTKDKVVYKMIGRRNSLGNQGVHVLVQTEDSGTRKRSLPKPPPGAHAQATPRLEATEGPDPNPGAVYLQLDTWAVDPETLSLELARDEFANAGTLFVWFFRGDRAVWQEQIRWPGY